MSCLVILFSPYGDDETLECVMSIWRLRHVSSYTRHCNVFSPYGDTTLCHTPLTCALLSWLASCNMCMCVAASWVMEEQLMEEQLMEEQLMEEHLTVQSSWVHYQHGCTLECIASTQVHYQDGSTLECIAMTPAHPPACLASRASFASFATYASLASFASLATYIKT